MLAERARYRQGIRYVVTAERPGRPIIIFVHGLGESLDHWLTVASDLRRDYQVVAFDLPGCGLSEKVPGLTREELLERNVDLIQTVVPSGSCIVAAHSYGVLMAADLVVRLGSRVEALVLADAALYRASKAVHFEIRSPAALLFTLRMWLLIAAAHVPLARWSVDALASSQLLRSIFLRHVLRYPQQVPDERIQQALRYSGRNNGLDLLRISRSTTYCEVVRRVTCPVWIGVGDADWVVRNPDIERTGQLTRVRSVTCIQACGHWSIVEQPGKVADLIRHAAEQSAGDAES